MSWTRSLLASYKLRRDCKFVEAKIAALSRVDVHIDSRWDEQRIANDPTAILDTNTFYTLRLLARDITPFDAPFSYVVVVHHNQVAHLLANSRWSRKVADATNGHKLDVRGVIGVCDGVLIVESPLVRRGEDSTGAPLDNVRRAVVFGNDDLSNAFAWPTYAYAERSR